MADSTYCAGCFEDTSRDELNENKYCEECAEYFSDWTYEKPLCEDVPDGYEIVDVRLEEKHFSPHTCNCECCDVVDEYEKYTCDLGIVMQEGEAYGKRITWFDIDRKKSGRWSDPQAYCWGSDPTHGGDPGLEHPVGIGSTHYLGKGCWTRYETDHNGDSPYGEHVVRQLKKKGTVSEIEKAAKKSPKEQILEILTVIESEQCQDKNDVRRCQEIRNLLRTL